MIKIAPRQKARGLCLLYLGFLINVKTKRKTNYSSFLARRNPQVHWYIEITRFKGLGEISPDEFGKFIGDNIKLKPVILQKDTTIQKMLGYYMGKNTPERQEFIIDNLYIEKDLALGEKSEEEAGEEAA